MEAPRKLDQYKLHSLKVQENSRTAKTLRHLACAPRPPRDQHHKHEEKNHGTGWASLT
jgi:hypothetical protein